ncbi:MAG: complex I NDUFA9 subunit family protein [Alphaproteobacteria bacterium]|nr:complex I NDUFA9 subunit family protein [Alphaproteobacteria bacterium]
MSRDTENKLVTVIGGSGFLGHQIVRRLARDGYRIRVTTRKPSHALSLQPLGNVGQIAIIKADIRNEAAIARAVEGASIVINLVGILKPSGGRTFDAIHNEGAATVARLAAKAGGRLIHISAIGADPEARSSYASSKGEGEVAVRQAFPRATILRPSVVFGQGDGFFNRFAALIRMSRVAFPLFGGGTTKFQPVFVGDVADAVANAAADARTQGRTYELGGPGVYTLKEILELVAKTTERKRMWVPIPFFLLDLGAALTGWLPYAPVTLDQARLLRKDNVVKAGADAASVGTLADLGVQPTAVEAVLETYLYPYRPTGQYAEPRGA